MDQKCIKCKVAGSERCVHEKRAVERLNELYE